MQLEVDLMRHGPLSRWNPQIGDSIFKDGMFSRWCGVIDGVNGNDVNIRVSGNPRLLVSGDYKSKVVKVPKIINAMVGSYFVITKDGTYYV